MRLIVTKTGRVAKYATELSIFNFVKIKVLKLFSKTQINV